MEQLGIRQVQEPHEVGRIGSRSGGGQRNPEQRDPERRQQRQPGRSPASAELALALDTPGRAELEARPEVDATGELRIRITDRRSGQTIAVVTPEELATLARATGLPAGLLVERSS